jgi:hypothetical protein
MNHKIHILTKFVILHIYSIISYLYQSTEDPTCTLSRDKEFYLLWLYGYNIIVVSMRPSEDGLLRRKHVKDIRG